MTDLHWIAAGDYQLALDGTTITAKNAKGRVLKTVPAKAKKTPEYEQLNNCRIYLEQHQKECLRQVSEWFLKGLPVPVLVVSEVWPDPLWRACFENLVVCVTATGDTGRSGMCPTATCTWPISMGKRLPCQSTSPVPSPSRTPPSLRTLPTGGSSPPNLGCRRGWISYSGTFM